MEITDVIRKAYDKYVCLQKEEIYIDYEENKCITIRWYVYMDKFVNKAFLKRVSNVANYLKKYTDLPIYDSWGNTYNKSIKKELKAHYCNDYTRI